VLFLPLFVTSYTAIDYLREHAFFGAKQIVVSTASSKTAYGAAWCMAQEDIPLIALTGDRNRAFVEGLRVYQLVRGYDEIETLPSAVPTLYRDLAGDPGLRRVHAHFGASLTYDCLVGSTRATPFRRTIPIWSGPGRNSFSPPPVWTLTGTGEACAHSTNVSSPTGAPSSNA